MIVWVCLPIYLLNCVVGCVLWLAPSKTVPICRTKFHWGSQNPNCKIQSTWWHALQCVHQSVCNVWSVTEYDPFIWVIRTSSCINAVQSRAVRFFLGVGKYMPKCVHYGECCWHLPHLKQRKSCHSNSKDLRGWTLKELTTIYLDYVLERVVPTVKSDNFI